MSDTPRQLPNELDGDYINRLADHFGIPRYMTKQIRLPEKQSSGWQPIETAPKDGTRLIVFAHQYGTDYFGYCYFEKFSDGSSGWLGGSFDTLPHGSWTADLRPTHWLMPLPAPPAPREET